MTTTSEPQRVSMEESVKRTIPFDWGFGSTPRTKKLRDAICWKSSVSDNELEDAAIGLPVCHFRPGVRIDMNRARLATAAFRETEGQPKVLQYARMVEKLCDEMPIFIKDGELIVGDANGGADKIRWYPETNVDWMPEAVTTGGFAELVTEDERREILEDICPYWKERSIVGLAKSAFPEEIAPTIMSHGTFITNTWEAGLVAPSWDWDVLYRDGLAARIASAEASLKELDEKVTEMDPGEYLEKKYNWQAMVRSGKAIIRYGERLSALAREQAAAQKDEKRRKELEEMAEVLQHVPANPPRTLQESLQFYWTVEVVVHYFARWGVASGARFDQIWWPYYEADMKAGRIKREDALELVECLFMKIQEIGCPLEWPLIFAGISGSNTLYTANICGTTLDGKDASNDLSCIVMEALAYLRLTQPPMALRYHPNIAPEVMETAINLVRTGLGHPSYFNEDLIEAWALTRGYSAEDAKKARPIGCVAYNIIGTTQICTGLVNVGTLNSAMVLEEVLHRNDQEVRSGHIVLPAGKKAIEMQSADELLEAYLERVKYYSKIGQVSWNIVQQVLMDHKPDPANSLLNDVTLDRGIDLLRYNKEDDTWPSIIIYAAINASDSLAAIQKLVFDEKKYTMEELITALQANWEGHEVMRQDFLNAPKHGNDDDYADDWAVKVIVGMDDVIKTFKDGWGCPFGIDSSTATGYTMMGLISGAGPDGRKASTPLADGTRSPMAGSDMYGPTSVLNSVGKVPFRHTELFNQRFMSEYLEGDNRKVFADYLKVWHSKGIPHVQFNVVSSEVLREAKAQPEDHSDLIVRVAGYSAHFIDLAENTQDSIIERTEQAFN